MIEVAICTHNPSPSTLSIVLNSLARQTSGPGSYRVLLVDNASSPPLTDECLTPLRQAGIDARLVTEPTPGLSRARIKAIEETSEEWLLFVDDDNELSATFIADGLDFISKHPEVGCFGGKLILPAHLTPPSWVTPFLPYLGIKDFGNEIIINKTVDGWGPWEPAGAGAWVHRKVLTEYRRRSLHDENFFALGRTGKSNLASCDDSLLMRCAYRIDMANAYVPQLSLKHHLSPHRFKFSYLIRLMNAYGRSHVVLENVLKGQQQTANYYATITNFRKLVPHIFTLARKKSLPFALGQIAYHIGARSEYRRQREKKRST
mgnify:CR=1 FL=1